MLPSLLAGLASCRIQAQLPCMVNTGCVARLAGVNGCIVVASAAAATAGAAVATANAAVAAGWVELLLHVICNT
jgi:hypothetical protein